MPYTVIDQNTGEHVELYAPIVTPISASGIPISTRYAPNVAFELEAVTLHLDVPGITAEDFTVTLDALDGPAYDTVLLSQNLSTEAVTDLLWQPEGGSVLCEAGDAITVTWPNTENRTYGLRIVARVV